MSEGGDKRRLVNPTVVIATVDLHDADGLMLGADGEVQGAKDQAVPDTLALLLGIPAAVGIGAINGILIAEAMYGRWPLAVVEDAIDWFARRWGAMSIAPIRDLEETPP